MIDMVQKQSVVDLAVGSITSYICGSNLAIGDKLPPEVQMTHMLGISRPALREAYARLQVFGFIDLLPGRGAFVRSKNKNFATDPLAWFKEHKAQIKDYLEVRLELDPLAASLAARNRSNDDIRILKEAKEKFETAYQAGDADQMTEADAAFHNAIAQSPRNELLVAIINLINGYCAPLREQSLSLQEHASHAIQPHQKIFDAIVSGNETQAAEESRKHMQTALADICDKGMYL